MYHSKNGLFFFRLADSGEVRIVKTRDGKMPDPATNPPESEVTLTAGEWAEMVCFVSKDGWNPNRWRRARHFHGTDLPVERPELKDEGGVTDSAAVILAAMGEMMTKLGSLIQEDRILALATAFSEHDFVQKAFARNDQAAAAVHQKFADDLREIRRRHVKQIGG